MSAWLIVAVIFSLLAAVWSREKVQDAFLPGVYSSLERLAEKWLSFLLPLLAAVCIIVFWMSAPHVEPAADRPGEPVSDTPTSTSGPTPGTGPAKKDASTPQVNAGQFRVVSKEVNKADTPVRGASVTVGQDMAVSDANGLVRLLVSTMPPPDALVRISERGHATRFLRFDDSALAAGRDIGLSKKMRVLVVSTGNAARSGGSADEDMRRSFESHFGALDLDLLADEKQRGEVIKQLRDYSEGRALYDPATIVQIGNFYGATHGIFLSVERRKDSVEATARLVNFTTAKIEHTASVPSRVGDDEGGTLAELILSQLADLGILRPRTNSICGRAASLEGFALFVPERWKVWISVQPDGAANHYPQLPVTLQSDGPWNAPNVFLGEEVQSSNRSAFTLYAILTDEGRSSLIDAYLRAGTNRGIDLSQWDKRSYRILDHIKITRDAAATMCAEPRPR